MTPDAFIDELTKLVQDGRDWDALALWEYRAPELSPSMTPEQRLRVTWIFEVVDEAVISAAADRMATSQPSVS